ncbi:MAG TPA: hypothetical protein VHP34_01515 [Alphaproteobacteria bacterium]|nr:hypothetical protein [Alphaproteobacteria bacterium]
MSENSFAQCLIPPAKVNCGCPADLQFMSDFVDIKYLRGKLWGTWWGIDKRAGILFNETTLGGINHGST